MWVSIGIILKQTNYSLLDSENTNGSTTITSSISWVQTTNTGNENRKTYVDKEFKYTIQYPQDIELKVSNEYDPRLDANTHSIVLNGKYYRICIWETCRPSGTAGNKERNITIPFLGKDTAFQWPIRSVTGLWSGSFDDFICGANICIFPTQTLDANVMLWWEWVERKINQKSLKQYNEYQSWYKNYENKREEIAKIIEYIKISK